MEWPLWILVVAVIWIGTDIALEVRQIKAEARAIRQALTLLPDGAGWSIPHSLLNEIGELRHDLRKRVTPVNANDSGRYSE
jgi:hypothetical protein